MDNRVFLKRDASSFDICLVHCINVVKCIQMLQFYARVVVELELRYAPRPLNHKLREYFVYRDGHGLGSMAIHLAHHCFSFNMVWM